ncbi:MAG: tripartite tricarboxylate transporter substrate binding protein [Pseudomonadota bacterium]
MKLLMLICLICQFAVDGWAQRYPAKVVRLLVPFAAGSGADTMGRIVAAGLTEVFGQQVIVENRAGAAGNIGAEVAAKAPADGYMLFQASLTHAVNVSLYRKLPYDLVRDFAPVTQLASSPHVVVVHPSLPVKSIGDLVKLAKAKPGAINYAGAGLGTATFLAAELFKGLAGINLVYVPYRGGGEALTAVISGETSVYFAPVAIALPFIRERRFRPLAVTTAKRLPAMPEYPTVAEAGYPGYAFGNWFGLLVPAKIPKETVATIHGAAISVLNNPDVSKRLKDLGFVLIGDQPEEFAAHIKSETEKMGKIIRETGVTAE